jgi:SAM-dependent methyltransferase
MIGADPVKGYWVHMLELYSDPNHCLDRVLSLACGHGHQERTLAKFRKFRVCDALDISEAALDNARRLAEAEGLHNINYERCDLNELKLSQRYDMVIAGGIHHITNLERLFEEISRSLTPSGFLLMYEYIGPSQCQPTARQVEAINACIQLLPRRYRVRISAQRKLGVTTPEEALALLESPDFKRPEPTIVGDEQLETTTGSSAKAAVEATPLRKSLARILDLFSPMMLGIQRGDFIDRLKLRLALRPQAPKSPESVQAIQPVEPTPLPDEYFWTKFVPMTREQWNAVDPSEAARSDEIITLLRKHFRTVDVRYTGGSIMQFTLHDIAGNFYEDNEEARDILDMLFKIEEVLVKHDDVPQNYAVIVAKNG